MDTYPVLPFIALLTVIAMPMIVWKIIERCMDKRKKKKAEIKRLKYSFPVDDVLCPVCGSSEITYMNTNGLPRYMCGSCHNVWDAETK